MSFKYWFIPGPLFGVSLHRNRTVTKMRAQMIPVSVSPGVGTTHECQHAHPRFIILFHVYGMCVYVHMCVVACLRVEPEDDIRCLCWWLPTSVVKVRSLSWIKRSPYGLTELTSWFWPFFALPHWDYRWAATYWRGFLASKHQSSPLLYTVSLCNYWANSPVYSI